MRDITAGIESETLRIDQRGVLSQKDHPFSLIQNHFSRDFSESQLELVSDPHRGISKALEEIQQLEMQAQSQLSREFLWPFSMPPSLPEEEKIPIARIPGKTPNDHSAIHYRRGLAQRYGRARQMICGIHINLSAPSLQNKENKNRLYLNTARFLYTHLDSLIFLTGASPIKDGHLQSGKPPILSLRNSPMGYAGPSYKEFLDLKDINAYISGIEEGMSRVHPAYHQLGLVKSGRIEQLSTSVFQTEKEFYAPIRLRSIPKEKESPLQAMETRGVDYLELRFLDRDPYYPGGVSPQSLRLLEMAFRSGWNYENPIDLPDLLVQAEKAASIDISTAIGDPMNSLGPIIFKTAQFLTTLEPMAEWLDRSHKKGSYRDTIDYYRKCLKGEELLPSIRLYQDFKQSRKDWTQFGIDFIKEKNHEQCCRKMAIGI